jgi:hypothetical protein
MIIELKEITIRDVVKGYINNDESGCIAYNTKLNIRPAYQREFVYKEKQRNAVIETVKKNFPLNVMYWVQNEDGTFEVLDGQQRTISICEYIAGNFSLDYQYFHNLEDEEKEKILDYKLMIYFCEGENREKLDWFKIINIAGEKLTDQELRNAIYTGTWLSDAKKYFSKTSCPAYNIGSQYLIGSSIRQDYLETTIKWISEEKIEEYMSKNQHKPNANELWTYFQNVINWINLTFIEYRKEMKGIDFGLLYNKFKNNEYDGKAIEKNIENLMLDDEITNKKGIYSYILTKDEKHLNIRAFTDKQKRQVFEKQKGTCAVCKKEFDISEMEADHITPWCEGGKTDLENCQMLCKLDNRRKSKN